MNDVAALLLDTKPHRKPVPPSWYERLDLALGLVPTLGRTVEFASGIGDGARGFANRSARVTALEEDAGLLAEAELRGTVFGAGQIQYVNAKPEASGLDADSAELVTVVQDWRRLDGAKAAAEAFRLLKSGGRIVIGEYAWQPLPKNIVEATEALIVELLPSWRKGGTNGRYSEWLEPIRAAGFVEYQTFLHDVDAVFTPEEWRRYTARQVAGKIDETALHALDVKLAALLAKRPGAELIAPHRVFALIAQKP